ncbi:MAG: hypothetical protein ACI94Y_003749 [Maribacter sp.]|jgi:hypothetical protein
MSKMWMIFYSSLVTLGVMASKGCESKTGQKQDKIPKEILASTTDDALHALLIAERKRITLFYATS